MRSLWLIKYQAVVAVLFLLMSEVVSAASLEITASPLISLPALVFVASKKPAADIMQHRRVQQAQIISYMSTFKPAIQVLPVGTELDVINADPILHNTHVFDHDRTLFNVATPIPGTSVQRTLSRPGLFNVRCDLHPSMNAWIAVVSNPYYAVIEKSGTYNIDNIASGNYELHVLQAGKQEQVFAFELVPEQQKKIRLSPR